ncbi:TPA: hypothetical protein I7264_03130 [Vibrio parahaemolyticus]|uniref:Uncharacterized protein n=2 Tax=Vibrio TaxID=662 RepID=A0AA47JM18_VIBPH|nr:MULTISPECIES: hypothetical protein [Vibrio]ELY5142026.1 hypothetical protein [Vibrio vulnificus]MBE3697021.1 hypothetical protein [Vibrio parahaemolyticus]MBE3745051.1 hypothetical protein [Vibrio parahaemolyticus]MBE3777026.1 hypothetical protein [Vibrio parahaemolyticus]MBE4418170.1 hypothetical protein [Vibrio parahaemolyticus]
MAKHNAASQYFHVAIGSSISPRELHDAGFEMQDFKFLHTNFEDVKARLRDFFVVDESNHFQIIYRFERLPF